MKCKYKFLVHGKVSPSHIAPVPCGDWDIELEVSEGFLTHILVIVPNLDREDWPKVQSDPSPGVKLHIEPKTPHLSDIQLVLISLQGLLALYGGLKSIELDNPEIEWIPETDQEKLDLQLLSFQRRVTHLSDEEAEPFPFALLARVILACDAVREIEVPLSFFRRGMNDLVERKYIEAIYDYYFLFETLFANGKFRKVEVVKAFRNSEQFCSSVEKALSDSGFKLGSSEALRNEFKRSFATLNVDQALEKIFDIRGFLHHHSNKNRDKWHPDKQLRFECEALFFERVALDVILRLAQPYVFSEDVESSCEKLSQTYSSS